MERGGLNCELHAVDRKNAQQRVRGGSLCVAALCQMLPGLPL